MRTNKDIFDRCHGLLPIVVIDKSNVSWAFREPSHWAMRIDAITAASGVRQSVTLLQTAHRPQ